MQFKMISVNNGVADCCSEDITVFKNLDGIEYQISTIPCMCPDNWSSWSSWSLCAKCYPGVSVGEQLRTRTCLSSASDSSSGSLSSESECQGCPAETRPCNCITGPATTARPAVGRRFYKARQANRGSQKEVNRSLSEEN